MRFASSLGGPLVVQFGRQPGRAAAAGAAWLPAAACLAACLLGANNEGMSENSDNSMRTPQLGAGPAGAPFESSP